MSGSHSRLSVLPVIALLIALALPASSQVDQAQLATKLTGATVVPKIALGDTGRSDRGGSLLRPIVTAVYPGGNVRYQIATLVGPLVVSQFSTFDEQGFEVGSVASKKDNLAITLTPILHPEKSATLWIMFEKGWQSKMSTDAVMTAVEEILTITKPKSSSQAETLAGVSSGTEVSQGPVLSAKDAQKLKGIQRLILDYERDGNWKYASEKMNELGWLYMQVADFQKAETTFANAMQAALKANDLKLSTHAMIGLGAAYQGQGNLQKAVEVGRQTVKNERDVGDEKGLAAALVNLGGTLALAGDYQAAIAYLTEALPLKVQLQDRFGQANALANLGVVYANLDDQKKAIEEYTLAEAIYNQLEKKDYDGVALSNLGASYTRLGDAQTGIQFINRALPMLRDSGNRREEAQALAKAGDSYLKLNQRANALSSYDSALPLARATKDQVLEARVYSSLFMFYKTEQPALSIFFGKQCIRILQGIRGDLQHLDSGLSAEFLKSNIEVYHDLAELLVAQNRLPEAQEVLDLMKSQEYVQYARGANEKIETPTLSQAEEQGAEEYQKATAQLVSLGQRWSQLKAIGDRTTEQDSEFRQLSDQMSKASSGLNDYFSRLYNSFGASGTANKQLTEVKGTAAQLKLEISRTPNAVAIYTIVTKAKYTAIVITNSTMVAREVALSEDVLNGKIEAFRLALRNPGIDPKPQALELYKILIGPVKADLDQAQAKTLVWVLDGKLRYIPMDALYDGKQYLVENYANVSITPSSVARLDSKPDVSKLSVAAMGISDRLDPELPALPAVVGELKAVTRDAQVHGASGALPGTMLINGEFTEAAMKRQLEGNHPVVHIASHFMYREGDDRQSYLLLAGKDQASSGFHLTVADFRDDPNLSLDGTELLTLSACDTGINGNIGNGLEVDGLATTVQLKGAKSVISSLWSVDDASTGMLMADFYKRWIDGAGKVEKVEALRQAQLDLLLGTPKPTPSAGSRTKPGSRGLTPQKAPQASAAPYSHPYYWAPFVLMGNWQ